MTQPENEEKKKCSFCDNALAIFGIGAALVFLFVAVDLLMDGKMTSLVLPKRGKAVSDDES